MNNLLNQLLTKFWIWFLSSFLILTISLGQFFFGPNLVSWPMLP